MEHLHADTERHLATSFASAAGLMQLSSAAVAAHAAAATDSSSTRNATAYNDSSTSSSSVASAMADASLPSGWYRIIHGSGLPCYVHDRTAVVCWTRPYPLDVGGNGVRSQSELHRLVQQHVPPLSIFAPASDVAAERGRAMSLIDSMSTLTHYEPSNSKKRKLHAAIAEHKGRNEQAPMTLEEFKQLSIGDPRVLQACMELSVKTPAQVLQEYKNRHHGMSINYNTVSLEDDGVKLFKTIVSAGSAFAEGVASTKKISKQLGAQQLLALLHERTAQRYYEVAEMYNNAPKGQPVITGSSKYRSVTNSEAKSGSSNGDPRFRRGNSASSRVQVTRTPPSNQEYVTSDTNLNYELNRHRIAPSQGGLYGQQPMQHVPHQAGLWIGGGRQQDAGMDNAGPERVVVYRTIPARSAVTYGDGQYYNNTHGSEFAWGSDLSAGHPAQPNFPGGYSQQYGGGYREAQSLPEDRPYGQIRTLGRSNASIGRVAANLGNRCQTSPNEMSNRGV
uniref:WW domain-containing protein n=1 Tax=Peronospora matthiolae TaxID=2874970 RepID=A0AAV1UJK7_9STRA